MNRRNLCRIGPDSASLSFLYRTVVGRLVLKVLISPWVSKVAGRFLDSSLSKGLIAGFIKNNGIDMDEYVLCSYGSFNEFFSRHIKKERRPLSMDASRLMCPCDGLLSVYEISDGLVVPVKQSKYSISELLEDEKLASEFDGGYCLVYRLCVDHYHRYVWAESGKVTDEKRIEGVLHTVRPIALEETEVFARNSREYAVIETSKLGKLVQMEVGALLVGRIDNHAHEGMAHRGEEKGRFQYGGSTIILLVQKDRVVMDDWILQAAKDGYEIPVLMGEVF